MSVLAELVPGTIFAGEFRVERMLSQGGMGAVYVAQQMSTGSPRALKLMHPQLVRDESLRKRFELEARVGARIESDHVVQVVDAGVDPQTGTPWLAMELLKGEDLATYVSRRGALPPHEVRLIFEQLCHAVGAAHAVGVVHRDLKPQNVFLAAARRVGSSFMVKVLDFGIAKVAAEAKGTDTQAMGSPTWMAPEQTSRGQLIGPPTDVWALALVAFYMLTGQFFWRSVTDQSSTVASLLREIVLDPIPPASLRASEMQAAGRLPPGFDAWFAKCLDRSPVSRFRDAREAFGVLAPILAAAAAGVPPPPPPPPQGMMGTAPPQQSYALAPIPVHTAPQIAGPLVHGSRPYTPAHGQPQMPTPHGALNARKPPTSPVVIFLWVIGGGFALLGFGFVVLVIIAMIQQADGSTKDAGTHPAPAPTPTASAKYDHSRYPHGPPPHPSGSVSWPALEEDEDEP